MNEILISFCVKKGIKMCWKFCTGKIEDQGSHSAHHSKSRLWNNPMLKNWKSQSIIYYKHRGYYYFHLLLVRLSLSSQLPKSSSLSDGKSTSGSSCLGGSKIETYQMYKDNYLLPQVRK